MSKTIGELKELAISGIIDWVYTLDIESYSLADLKELYTSITTCKPRGTKQNILNDLQNHLYQKSYYSAFDEGSSNKDKSTAESSAFVLVPHNQYLQPDAERYDSIRNDRLVKFYKDLEKAYDYNSPQRFICVVNNSREAEQVRDIIYNKGFALTKIYNLLDFDAVYKQFKVLSSVETQTRPSVVIIHADLEPKLVMKFKEDYTELGRL